MRALLIAVFAMALVGCASAPQSDMAGVRKSASKVSAKKAKPIAAKKIRTAARVKYTGTISPSPAVRPKASDPTTEKAKGAIAAMLDDPASAEFYKLQRAQKKLLHRPVDAICGYVRTKSAKGKAAGGTPFLYIVGHDREDEAYLVNGRSQVAATVHGALCR
jgi:hypothetical protein